MTSNVIPFSTMKDRVGKKNVTHSPSKWVYPTTTQTEDEFYTSDEIPFGTSPNATSFATITKQVRKKGVPRSPKKTGYPQNPCLYRTDWYAKKTK